MRAQEVACNEYRVGGGVHHGEEPRNLADRLRNLPELLRRQVFHGSGKAHRFQIVLIERDRVFLTIDLECEDILALLVCRVYVFFHESGNGVDRAHHRRCVRSPQVRVRVRFGELEQNTVHTRIFSTHGGNSPARRFP